MYCRTCGTEISDSDQFCRKCGRTLANTAAAVPPPAPAGPAAKQKKSFAKSLFLAFLVFIVLGAIIDSFKGRSGANSSNLPSAVPQATPDRLSPAQHVSELKKLVAKHPLDTTDADAIEIQIKQLQLKKADSEKSTAVLIKNAEDRVRWVKVRDDVRIDAVVACKTATTSMLKAPDSVEWKDHEEGYDPNQDWIYNVDLQANAMNSFGAKLRSTFYCSAVCTDKEGSNGLRCIAMKVREGE